MRMGLVGSTIYYGGVISIASYLVWEVWNIGKDMPQIEEDHPVNEIFARRRNERRLKTIRDQPLVKEQPMTRFEWLQQNREKDAEMEKEVERPKVKENVIKKQSAGAPSKDDDDGYM